MQRGSTLHDVKRVLIAAIGGVGTATFAFSMLAAPLTPAGRAPSQQSMTLAQAEMEQATTITVRIEAAKQDATGQPTQVQISDARGERFLIIPDGKGKELAGHVGKSVTVTGRLLSEGPAKRLQVKSYRLTQG
jgi:hypothetical protein